MFNGMIISRIIPTCTAAIAIGLTLSACGFGPSPEEVAAEKAKEKAAKIKLREKCDSLKLPTETLDQIQGGANYANVELVEAYAVPIRDEFQKFGLTHYVAAKKKVTYVGADETEVEHDVIGFAISSVDQPTLIVGTDHLSRLSYSWGSAMKEGSPIYRWALDLSMSKTADSAEKCLTKD